jgi:hypothetical protein
VSKLIPSFLLAVVAMSQIVLARTAWMTPWKGGGFGMFSTLDHGAYRGVDVVIEAPERSESQDIPPSLEELAARVASCPTDWLLRGLAQGVVAREQRYERSVTRVKLTVWRTAFDPVTLTATEQTLRTFVYDVSEMSRPR